jgi:RNA polymerase sigma-70 factor (ECF subfamily)
MTGSVLDGEDVVQEALFLAYRKLDTFDDTRPLGPWLFRIAHNRCIDFLRHREVQREAEAEVVAPDWEASFDPLGPAVGEAVESLVLALPPKERACVLLKDVLDYSLDEIAELVDSTVGGVKAALSRGRAKLAETPHSGPKRARSDEHERLLRLYVERFNRQDWDGLRELIASDARLLVADRFAGPLSGSPYFGNYERWPTPWRMAVGEMDGELVIVSLRLASGAWSPASFVRLQVTDGCITDIDDYSHCPWIIHAVLSLTTESPDAVQ